MKTYTVQIDCYGNKCYINEKGQLHREDGPAVENIHNRKEWCKHGKWHREDGPAVEYPNGDKYWYLNGVQYTQTEFNVKMKLGVYTNIKNERIVEMTMTEINKLLGYKIKIVESH